MRKSLITISLILSYSTGVAQNRATGPAPRQTTDSVFLRAVALSNEQRGVEARALVDSVLRAAGPTSTVYGEGLFWKGTLAESDQVAEESYKRIVLDFPLHRRAEESLIRLAQLEIMRGNRTQAQRYLDRIVVEHPYGQHRARASYWRARILFEENELDRACAELGTARARIADTDVELKTEIDIAARRCTNVPAPSGAGQRAAAPPSDSKATGAAAPPTARGQQPPASRSTRGAAGGATTTGRAARGGSNTGRAGSNTGATGQAARSGTAARGTGDSTKSNAKASVPAVMYSVQAAAFPSKANAEAFIEALKSRGYEARLVGTDAMFRVRVGMFATRDLATALANELKTKGVSSQAFVVEAERRE